MMNRLEVLLRYCYGLVRPRPSFYHSVHKVGINLEEKRGCRVVISLTSFPVRMKTVPYTIETLLSQSYRPDEVILWLAEEQFPNRDDDLPYRLRRLQQYGLTIKWCNDIRSYKKLVPTVQLYPNDIIVTADDDVYYPPQWLSNLISSYQKDKSAIHCNRGNVIKTDSNGYPLPYNSWGLYFLSTSCVGYNILMTGVGGVLYPPYSLYEDVIDADKFMVLSKDADDLWFWAMAVLQGTPIKVIENNQNDFEPVYMVGNQFLWSSNQNGHNDQVISNLFSFYPRLSEILQQEAQS